jgi:hypothetical protein
MIEPHPAQPVVLTNRAQAAPTDPRINHHTRTALQAIMRQLNKSLTVLASAADMLTQGRRGGAVSQSLLIWLQPNARQAEEALRRLREYQLTGSSAATELIQCLTVLVLAADMIVQGQLRDDTSLETYELLRRNADRALKSMEELKKEVLM